MLYPRDEPKDSEPLIVPPLVVDDNPTIPESFSSDCVVHKVKSFCHVVRLSFEGFEDELMALFTAIEARHHQTVQLILLALCQSQQTEGIMNYRD